MPQHRIQIYTEAKPVRVKHLFSARGFSKWRGSGGKKTVEGRDNLVSRQTFDLYSVYRGVYHRPHSLPPPNGRCYRPRDTVLGPHHSHAPRRSPFAIYSANQTLGSLGKFLVSGCFIWGATGAFIRVDE